MYLSPWVNLPSSQLPGSTHAQRTSVPPSTTPPPRPGPAGGMSGRKHVLQPPQAPAPCPAPRGPMRCFPEAPGQTPPHYSSPGPAPPPPGLELWGGWGAALPAPSTQGSKGVDSWGCCPLPPGPRQPPTNPSIPGGSHLRVTWNWNSCPLGPRGLGQELSSRREWGWGPRKARAGVSSGHALPPFSPLEGSTGPGRVPWAPSLAHRGDLWPWRRLRPPSQPPAARKHPED